MPQVEPSLHGVDDVTTAGTDDDSRIRQQIYDVTLSTGTPPGVVALGLSLALAEAEVRNGLQRLAAAHVLVLQPQSGEILMAAPFSAVPTNFLVQTPRYRAFANCIWDALGIPAMTGEPATIETACGCCGEQMRVEVGRTGLEAGEGIIHFAIPAAGWWQDIVFT